MSRRLLRRVGLALLLGIAVDQVLQHTVLADGMVRGRFVAPFDPPLFQRGQRRRLEQISAGGDALLDTLFDAELGWAPRAGTTRGRFTYDERGARVDPDAPAATDDARRLALVGCSFTHGDEVDAADTWAARLARERDDVHVRNFGMGAYGLDQALLRLVRDALPDGPDEVWMAWVPSTSLRATTHFPPLQNHWTEVLLFKPRYDLRADGTLLLAPNPARVPEDTARLLHDQRALLDAIGDTDFWIRRTPAAFAPRGSSWTHYSALARAVMTWTEARRRGALPWVADSASPVCALLRAIVVRAAEESSGAGARFRFVVLPSRRDLEAIGDGEPYWTAFVQTLVDAGVPVVDMTNVLRSAGAREDDRYWMPGGHFGPEVNALLASRLATTLEWTAR